MAGAEVVVLVAPEPALADAGGRGGRPEPAEGRGAGPMLVLLPPAGAETAPRLLQGGAAQARLALDLVDYGERGSIRFAGSAPAGTTVRVYVNDGVAGDAVADAEGRWVLVPAAAPPYGRHTLRLDQLAASGSVAARIEVPFQHDRVAGVAPGRGQVVVQPGESLWRLARTAYGDGTRYTVIYEANRGQIRNPDVIFPGQVLAVPSPASASLSR
jgi:hypothetical protein